jgi:hypothetical protein
MNDTSSGILVVAKLAPPASVTLASAIGMQVSEIVLWVTLVYTVLMIIHKLCVMYKDASAWWKS